MNTTPSTENDYSSATPHKISPLIFDPDFQEEKQAVDLDLYKPGSMAIVSGWGRTEAQEAGSRLGASQQTKLSVVAVPLVDHAECALRMGEKQKHNVEEDDICAGFEEGGADACTNDSGGPLVVEKGIKASSRFYVIGVVSSGIGCAKKEPGVYTNVSHHMEWIESEMDFYSPGAKRNPPAFQPGNSC